MIVVGITGTNGSGKGTVVEYLKAHGFVHLSGRAFIEEEVKKRTLEVNRENLNLVANDLRTKFGNTYIASELYKRAKVSGKNAVIESIRNPGEVEFLRKVADEEAGAFVLLAVDADPKLRYERIKERKSVTDFVSYEKFLSEEDREMHSTNPNNQNILACIALADYKLENNGTKEEFRVKLEELFLFLQTLR